MNVERGATYLWTANVWAAGVPTDVTTLSLTVRDPANAIVSGFPVAKAAMGHPSTGVYTVAWVVPAAASLGVYTATWTGSGTVTVNAEPSITVVASSAVTTTLGPIIAPSELAAVQADIAAVTMRTAVVIYHQTTAVPVSSSTDYGDDEIVYVGQTAPGAGIAATAWIVNKPSVDAVDSGGMIQTVSPGVMRMPVGTLVYPGDKVVVGAEEFVVIDTNNDDTFPAWLKVHFQSAQQVYGV